jgi:cysteine synthase
MPRIYANIVETVGPTPLVRLNRVTEGAPATILLKREFFNLLGSLKDWIGMAMTLSTPLAAEPRAQADG